MSDNDPLPRLNAYLDGELSADQRAELDEQLAGSPELAGELEALRRLGDTVRHAAQPQARLSELQMARLHQAVDRRSDTIVLRTAQFAAAIAAAILLACTIMFLTTNSATTPGEAESFAPGLTYVLAPDEGPSRGAALALMGGDEAGQQAQIARWLLHGLSEGGQDE